MPRNRIGEPKTRLQLVLPESVRQRLDELAAISGSDSLTEVIRRALAVYDLLLEHRRNGGQTLLQDMDRTRPPREVILVD